jgi:hypothetical protein
MTDGNAELILSRVTALLAAGPGTPDGDVRQGLEIVLVLDPGGRIGLETYYADPRPWRVRRFRPERPDWTGDMVREEESWALRGGPAEDGPLWFVDVRGLHPGEYLTLRRPDGEELVYRVVSVARAE